MSFVAPATVSMFISGLAFWLSYRTFTHNMREKKQTPIQISDLLKILDSDYLIEHHYSAKKELKRILAVLSIRQEINELDLPIEVRERLMLEHELVTEIRKCPNPFYILKKNGGFTRFTSLRRSLLIVGILSLFGGIFQLITAFTWPSIWQEPTIATIVTGFVFILGSLSLFIMYQEDVKDDLVREYYFLQGLKALSNKPIVCWKRWHRFIYQAGKKQAAKEPNSKSEFEVKNES